MIKVKNAMRAVLRNTRTLDSEAVKLIDSSGRVLGEDLYSGSDIPAFDNSAMDGYAVRSSDIRGTSKDRPEILKVIDNLKAGDAAQKTVGDRQAIRIMTGAVIPEGADSVVMVEETKKIAQGKNDFIEVYQAARRGENIRKKGEDIKKGARVIRKGTLLRSAHIGMLASLGLSKISVVKRPRVAVLATGDELIGVGRKRAPGKLYSSNTYTLLSQVMDCGAVTKDLGIARDRPGELQARIEKGLDCDMILTSGGVSVGDYDLVKSVLAKMGTDIQFWKVAMRPGKPLVFGHIRGIPVFGLPGNPVSSMVSFEVFVRPAIMKMLGRRQDSIDRVDALLEEGIEKKKGFMYFLRARTRWNGGSYLTRTTGPQGSGILRSMALANSLIILPEEEEKIERGRRVGVRFL